MPPMIDVRQLSVADLPKCKQLEDDRSWDTDEAKWRLMFEAGRVYAIDAADGDGLAGCVVLTPHGDALAAVGMMLVATRYSRQGVGTRLMQHMLDVAQDRPVELTATRFGKPVYERLGFRVVGDLSVHSGRLEGVSERPASGVRLAAADDYAAIYALDAKAVGADRSTALAALLDRADQVAMTDDGFAIAWTAGPHRVIGPVTAPSQEVAQDLVHAASLGADRDLRIDVSANFAELRDWLTTCGMPPASPEPLPIMIYGADQSPGDRTRYAAPILISMG